MNPFIFPRFQPFSPSQSHHTINYSVPFIMNHSILTQSFPFNYVQSLLTQKNIFLPSHNFSIANSSPVCALPTPPTRTPLTEVTNNFHVTSCDAQASAFILLGHLAILSSMRKHSWFSSYYSDSSSVYFGESSFSNWPSHVRILQYPIQCLAISISTQGI